jgi:uncharacterized protein YjbI with pentapeptide repeats
VANEEHVKILKQGVEVWNAWRHANPMVRPDLNEADLRGSSVTCRSMAPSLKPDLTFANLMEADLRGANLERADLRFANLSRANLRCAKLTGANLMEADLRGANLEHAILIDAALLLTILLHANLCGADLTDAFLHQTVFADVDLSSAIGLDTCVHGGPSIIDYRTLQKSGPLPLKFLRGVGLPDPLIEYFGKAVQYYSCFISYSAKDEDFAKHLDADLDNSGVRCWFAPHDLPIGEEIRGRIDDAIKVQDKVVLILSEHSIRSGWVKDEVEAAFEEEQKRGQTVLFPVRLDDAVLTTTEAWAAKLRRQRNIGDFRQWKDHDAYQQSFQRMLRDLTREQPAVPRHAEGDA